MPIHIVKGDLLESDCNIIAHQANCMSTMGSGIALQIKKKYPEACRVDQSFIFSPEKRLGTFTSAKVSTPSGEIFIGNLYGQYDYGTNKVQTDYKALENALMTFIKYIGIGHTKASAKIGLPYGIGCGLAGGDWPIVEKIIEKVSNAYGIDIYLYKLED